MRRIFGILILIILFGSACSDDNETPTDPGVQPAVSVGDQTVAEGNTVLFGVTLDQSTTHAVTFTYSTSDGTATAGADYYAAAGSDTIPAGQTSATILVPTIDDSEFEPTETFTFILNSVAGASVAKSTGTATINDNDVSGVSFATDIQPLLRTSCANLACHGGSFPGGNMYLGSNAEYADVINATGDNTALLPGSSDGKVIQVGNSAASTLYTKVDTTAAVPFGSRMPSGGASPLSRAQQVLLRDWIDQGAQDN
jgi:hypothetical protein